MTEHMLVEKMAQHFWLSQRAQRLADLSMDPEIPNIKTSKQELHSWRVLLAEAEADHRMLLNPQLQTPEMKAETAAKVPKLAS
jgi:hypothetical protein